MYVPTWTLESAKLTTFLKSRPLSKQEALNLDHVSCFCLVNFIPALKDAT